MQTPSAQTTVSYKESKSNLGLFEFFTAFFGRLMPVVCANPSRRLVFGFRNKIEVVNRKSKSAQHTVQLAYGFPQKVAPAFCPCTFGDEDSGRTALFCRF